MPETPEELYARVAGALLAPPVETWEPWPFAGPVVPRTLEPPLDHEPRRAGEGGTGCRSCAAPDDEFVWVDERWRLRALGPTGMPMVAILAPREHVVELADLPDDLGLQLGRVDRAIRRLGEIGNVHVCRFGDGSEHLHWWFIARPARFEQLRTSLVAVWDDVLPPVPAEIWQADVDALAAALAQ